MAFRALHGLAPPYLDQLVRIGDLPGRRRLRSSSSSYQLHVPTYRLATVGRRSFPIAASILWNSLPPDIQSSASLSIFCQRLKTHLFHQSFPDVLLQAVSVDYASVDFVITFVVLATLKIKL